jgi:hypothetical protein
MIPIPNENRLLRRLDTSSPALRAPSPPLGVEERDGERRNLCRIPPSFIAKFYDFVPGEESPAEIAQ